MVNKSNASDFANTVAIMTVPTLVMSPLMLMFNVLPLVLFLDDIVHRAHCDVGVVVCWGNIFP